ncbi:MAG: RHS repeat-associated core domain-containing protein, partial [Sphingomonadales bacterium]|nr:RHS repeat-associated core domain-containing protein [Sphingomonadales bacterium]
PDCLNGERFARGNVGLMTDASGSTSYCFDRYGQLARKLQTTQGRTLVLRYLHTDPRGRLPGQDYALVNPPPGNQHIGWTYPDGASVRIIRDALARPMELRVTLANGQSKILLHSASYYPFGPVGRWTFGNGRTLRRSVNENYQPGFIEDAAPGGISEGYWFDTVGNLESLQFANQGAPSRRRYTYDGLNRLTHVRDGSTNAVLQEYGYDATGNRTRKVENGNTTLYTYSPASHQLSQIGAQGRQYDAAGNTTRIEMTPSSGSGGEEGPPGGGGGDPGPGPIGPPPGETESMSLMISATALVPNVREFEYDDTNRMRAVKHDGVVAMNYLYNGVGERVYRAGTSGTATSVYDQAGHWIGDYDASGQAIQQVIWFDDLPVGLLVGAGANQKLYYIEADALGTPRVVIDPDRNLAVWRWDLAGEAFGDSMPDDDVDGDGIALAFDMRFQGQRFDSATGFNYNYKRDYDSGTGRYLQSDPIGLAGGVSTYGYASSRPMNMIDRFGMDGTCPVAPSYDPTFWNSGQIQRTNNCYSYAWDRPENPEGSKPRRSPCKPQPGGFICDDRMQDRSTCQKIVSQAIRDGMKRAKDGECLPCMRKVFLVMGSNREGQLDYHWYRQDADGMWSHKPGTSPVTNLDAAGNVISNPESADRDDSKRDRMRGVNYSRKCGYLCVPLQ